MVEYYSGQSSSSAYSSDDQEYPAIDQTVKEKKQSKPPATNHNRPNTNNNNAAAAFDVFSGMQQSQKDTDAKSVVKKTQKRPKNGSDYDISSEDFENEDDF